MPTNEATITQYHCQLWGGSPADWAVTEQNPGFYVVHPAGAVGRVRAFLYNFIADRPNYLG